MDMEVTTVNPNTAPAQKPQGTEEMLSLREIFDMVLGNWKWFVLSFVVCVVLASLYLATQSYVYQRQAVMLVKDDNGRMGSRRSTISNDALMQLNGVLAGSSVKNEVYILRSHQLMKEVVKNLHLDVMYSYKKGLKTVSPYMEKPFIVQFSNDEDAILSVFSVRIIDRNQCSISNMQSKKGKADFEKVVRFGQQVKTPVGTLTIVPQPEYLKDFIDKTINVTHLDLETAANVVAAKVQTGEMDRESSLVRLVCTDTDIKRADDILAALLEAYKQSIIADKNILAQSTADFIDERIQLISKELGEVEGQLAAFKQNNNIIDLSQNAQVFLQQTSVARQRTLQLQAQQSAVSYLLDYLKSSSEGNGLIPAMGGLTDMSIQSQITKYNELMLNRNRLIENSSENAITIRELDTNLQQMKQAIIASMKGYAATLDLQAQQAMREENTLQNTLSVVPQKEKQVMDISRQQSIKATLYTYLLNKREETALQLAISEANIRIVERPFGSTRPIAPRKLVIRATAGMIGLVIPFLILYLLSLLNMGVRGRKDIETYTSIPVIGEIPRIKHEFKDSQVMVGENSNDAVNEAFRLLRFNLGFVKKDACVIMFTSTMPGEGKTFVSRNFAHTLALLGKRVILLDTDIRKRTQTALYGASRHEGLTSYLSGAVDDFQNLIIHDADKKTVDVMPAGVVPPNPAELLMSERLDELIEKLKEIYDYIIVDNVPAQVVADAGIVNRVADLTVYVVRDRRLDRRYLPELERLHQEGKFNNLCILINDARVERKRYGYGYGYGYGRYGYGYGYGNNKK